MTVKEYVDLTNNSSYPYDDEVKEKIVQYNKELTKKYPFLIPRNVFTGDVVSDYDYTWTWLDDMPDGWRIAFSEDLLSELNSQIVEHNIKDYQILQIKEKFGGLRWYDNGSDDWIRKILPKYEALSEETCIRCGKPATWMSTGWISPYCDDCANYLTNRDNEWYSKNTKNSTTYKVEDRFEPMKKIDGNA